MRYWPRSLTINAINNNSTANKSIAHTHTIQEFYMVHFFGLCTQVLSVFHYNKKNTSYNKVDLPFPQLNHNHLEKHKIHYTHNSPFLSIDEHSSHLLSQPKDYVFSL